MQSNGHYAVQGHSKWPISVPIKSPCVTSYKRLLINTNLLPIVTISKLVQIIGEIFAFDMGVFSLKANSSEKNQIAKTIRAV